MEKEHKMLNAFSSISHISHNMDIAILWKAQHKHCSEPLSIWGIKMWNQLMMENNLSFCRQLIFNYSPIL